LPVRRMISMVPTPSADKSTISAHQPCFCGLLRLLIADTSRERSTGETVNDIPVRMHRIRMPTMERESRQRLLCQADTTSNWRF
jgi:hypothetical protein